MSRKIYNFKPSSILNQNENDLIKRLIGSRKESYATTVVEVYFSKTGVWKKQFTGVICFIKDHLLHGFFFRLYSIEYENLIWQQELYRNFQYVSEKDFFHLFEGEDCIVGFNFANKIEADYFRKRIHLKFPINQTRTASGKSKGKRVFTKQSISKPLNFQHLAHMPRNMNEEPFNINPELSEVFRKAGITDKNMRNDASRAIITQVIEERGYSLEINKIQSNWLPPVPARKAPPPPKLNGNSTITLPRISLQPNPPPGVFNSTHLKRNATLKGNLVKPQPIFIPSPVIKQQSRENQFTKESDNYNAQDGNPYGMKIDKVAPINLPRVNPMNKPPPPPDFNKFHAMMQPKPLNNNENNQDSKFDSKSLSNGRGAFLESFNQPNNENEDSHNNNYSVSTDTPVIGGRGALLDSIRKGVTLKPAKDRAVNDNEKQDLVSALKSALDVIEKANRSSSSDTDYYDDSDWSETDA